VGAAEEKPDRPAEDEGLIGPGRILQLLVQVAPPELRLEFAGGGLDAGEDIDNRGEQRDVGLPPPLLLFDPGGVDDLHNLRPPARPLPGHTGDGVADKRERSERSSQARRLHAEVVGDAVEERLPWPCERACVRVRVCLGKSPGRTPC
jgi:hypothetical protein